MFVPFESISPSSRIWIYQSDRKFTAQERIIADEYLRTFSENWAAHGQPLKTSFDIRYDQFIILAADEGYNDASGCSIDASVRAIKEIEVRFSVRLFDRNQIAFMKNDSVILVPLQDLKQKYLSGTWNEATPAFNNLISIKSQLQEEWIVAAGNTWLKRYVPTQKVAP